MKATPLRNKSTKGPPSRREKRLRWHGEKKRVTTKCNVTRTRPRRSSSQSRSRGWTWIGVSTAPSSTCNVHCSVGLIPDAVLDVFQSGRPRNSETLISFLMKWFGQMVHVLLLLSGFHRTNVLRLYMKLGNIYPWASPRRDGSTRIVYLIALVFQLHVEELAEVFVIQFDRDQPSTSYSMHGRHRRGTAICMFLISSYIITYRRRASPPTRA